MIQEKEICVLAALLHCVLLSHLKKNLSVSWQTQNTCKISFYLLGFMLLDAETVKHITHRSCPSQLMSVLVQHKDK